MKEILTASAVVLVAQKTDAVKRLNNGMNAVPVVKAIPSAPRLIALGVIEAVAGYYVLKPSTASVYRSGAGAGLFIDGALNIADGVMALL